MDILSHTLTGVAASTVVLPFCKTGLKRKAGIVMAGTLGGALPDIDVISLWSGFDTTFGKVFHLELTGKEIYFSKLWYGHHGFMHSIVAGLLFSGILYLMARLTANRYIAYKTERFKIALLCAFSFFAAFLFHLLEDMPTPASVWGGVRFFWPAASYIGGYGKIWWWNNYDLFLIISTVLAINFPMIAFLKRKRLKQFLPLICFALGCVLFISLVNTRTYDFSYSGHTSTFSEFELKSHEIQQKSLGKRTYRVINELDKKIPFNF